MAIVEALIRMTAATGSLLLFYVAWFVYEGEEKLIQSQIEAWWLQFDDLRTDMVTKQNAFLRVVATRAYVPLDRMLGDGRLSMRTYSVAVCLVVGSMTCVVAATLSLQTGLAGFFFIAFVQILLVSVVLFCAIGPAISPRYSAYPIRCFWSIFGLVLFSIVPLRFYQFNRGDTSITNLLLAAWWLVAIFFGSGITTWAILRLAKRGLAFAIEARTEWRAVPSLLVALVPCTVLLGSGIFLGGDGTKSGSFFLTLGAMALASGLAAAYVALILGIAIVMIVHRVMWPLLSRVLYNVPRHQLVESKKSLNAVALALMSIALGGPHLKEILNGTYFQQIIRHFVG